MKNTRFIDFVTFEISVLVLAAFSLALMFIEWISVWRRPLLNDQRYWSKTFERNACMRLELTYTNVKRTFLVCVSIVAWSHVSPLSLQLLLETTRVLVKKLNIIRCLPQQLSDRSVWAKGK